MKKANRIPLLVLLLLLTCLTSSFAAPNANEVTFGDVGFTPNRFDQFNTPFKSKGLYTDCYPVNEKFNQRRTYTGLADDTHLGVDISCDLRTPIYSVRYGEVVKVVDVAGSSSNYIVIEHNLGGHLVYTVYMHMDEINLNVGEKAYSNTIIGYSGPPDKQYHLHFGISKNVDAYYDMDYVDMEPFYEYKPYYNSGKDFDYMYDFTSNNGIVSVCG